jgi:HAD superfamily hydrolase (TIGR01549 family)
MAIKGIFFDFGQTLVDSANGFRRAEKDAQDAVFTDMFPGSENISWEKFLTTYRKIRTSFHQKSNFSRKSIWEEVYRCFDRQPDVDLLVKWETAYWETVKAHTRPFPEARGVLETLTGHYKLGLITNTQGQKLDGEHRINLFPELEQFFDNIIVAGEAGIPPKPNPEPFNLCLEWFAIDPDEAVYIGDDWRIDICGAKDVGLQAVWLQHHSIPRNWPEVETDVSIIDNLNQLPGLLHCLNELLQDSC